MGMQVGIGDAGEGQVSGGTATCDDRLAQEHHHHQQQNHQNIATAAFNNITRPSHPISTITSPPFDLHQTSLNMLHQDSYHISRLMLHNDPNLQVILGVIILHGKHMADIVILEITFIHVTVIYLFFYFNFFVDDNIIN